MRTSIVQALALSALVIAASTPLLAQPQLTAEQQAVMVINAGRKAFNERQYNVAVDRFREYLGKFNGQKDTPSAHYGLGTALLEMSPTDYKAAADALRHAAGANFPERPFAMYYLGVAQRGLGHASTALAKAKPPEAPQHLNQAKAHYQEAQQSFAQAAGLFAERVKAAPAPPAPPAGQPAPPPSPDREWLARCQLDQAEMLLRLEKCKEAQVLASTFLGDPAQAASQYRPLGLYYEGYANFAMRDFVAAGKALSQLAPFAQEFGVHARYLLGRCHHLAGERPEAANMYKAVLAAQEELKKKAAEALKNPAALQPLQKVLYEQIVQGPPPDYIPRSHFYLALLQAEGGQFAEALAAFTAVIQQNPNTPLVAEAQLRQGYCHLQTRNFAEAVKCLQPLAGHPQLGDQATWWMGRAIASGADPNNAQAYAQALAQACDHLRRAADLANQQKDKDPQAKVRRGDILMELADTQVLARQFKEASATLQQVRQENNNPDRVEEALQRQIVALQLSGMYKESDALCGEFEKTYPKSTLLASVLFRHAENAYLTAVTALNKNDFPRDQLPPLFTEAQNRYQRVLKQFPEYPHAGLARHALASCQHHLGQYAQAQATLASIPEVERNGELASTNYLLAECLIRQLPNEAEDALRAAEVVQQAENAAKLLEAFLASQAASPQGQDAYLKLGYCYQRVAALLADAAELKKLRTQAREAYEKCLANFQNTPAQQTAVFERGKLLALLGDVGGATNELGRFRGDPLRTSPVAPMALVRLSVLMRAQNKAAEAAQLMQECRSQHEAACAKDPVWAGWVHAMQYEHALALKDGGKLAEARALLEPLTKVAGPTAVNATWRLGQVRREELLAQLQTAREQLAKAGNPDQAKAAQAAGDKATADLRQAAAAFEAQAAELGKKNEFKQAELRLIYEAAWCHRAVAQVEIDAARAALGEQALKKVIERLAKENPLQQPPALTAPEVALEKVPQQPGEKAAIARYNQLLAAAEPSLALQARLELAEMHGRRQNPEGALEVLAGALDQAPSPELLERIRLRLAAALLDVKNAKEALQHASAVLANPASPLAGEARYLTGEACLQLKDYPKAVETLLPFRDKGELHQIADVSDRAMLRLGQAYALLGQWDPSRQALEALLNRYPNSPYVYEARYGIGWAWQNAKNFDQAIAAYQEVIKRTAAEPAARAQLQIGLCRLEQKRPQDAVTALLVVPYTYDYPDLAGQARCEAARAYVELKQGDQARKLLNQVVQDTPDSPWAKVAQQRLAEMKQAGV
ncbi:MAG TPA: tetratricopeptide repeat protein [Phycisphaerae bacterium]|nr:tetratricopeptide repeat protein [Phycisphaerae bacterium]